METYGVPYAEAPAAKALFDYQYLRTLPADLVLQRYSLAEELRLNLDKFTREEQFEFAGNVLKSEATRRGGANMQHILNNLEAYVWRRRSRLCRTSWLANSRCSLLKPNASS
jgi:hypothetical protein